MNESLKRECTDCDTAEWNETESNDKFLQTVILSWLDDPEMIIFRERISPFNN